MHEQYAQPEDTCRPPTTQFMVGMVCNYMYNTYPTVSYTSLVYLHVYPTKSAVFCCGMLWFYIVWSSGVDVHAQCVIVYVFSVQVHNMIVEDLARPIHTT